VRQATSASPASEKTARFFATVGRAAPPRLGIFADSGWQSKFGAVIKIIFVLGPPTGSTPTPSPTHGASTRGTPSEQQRSAS